MFPSSPLPTLSGLAPSSQAAAHASPALPLAGHWSCPARPALGQWALEHGASCPGAGGQVSVELSITVAPGSTVVPSLAQPSWLRAGAGGGARASCGVGLGGQSREAPGPQGNWRLGLGPSMCLCLLSAAQRPRAWWGAGARRSLLTRRADTPLRGPEARGCFLSLVSSFSTCSPGLTRASSRDQWAPVCPRGQVPSQPPQSVCGSWGVREEVKRASRRRGTAV